MKRRLTTLATLALAAFAVASAHADPSHRDGDRRGHERGGAGGVERGYGGPRGRNYAPAPYEPPLAPEYYRSRPDSLGAEWGQQQDQARMGVRQGRIMPLSRVVQNLERLRPGRVLDAGLETGPDGRAAYRVRWAAAGGQRIDFIIDAETGAIIGRGGE
jgi:hypothetical protein